MSLSIRWRLTLWITATLTVTLLAIFLSLSFARQWGGDIQVTSTPGSGSTFSIVIPAAAHAAAS